MRSKLTFLLIAFSIFAGCSSESSNRPKTYPVSGTVKLNGSPVEGATITFQLVEGKENAIGSSAKDGSYTLSMFKPNDGAIAGQYKVSISKFDLAPPKVSSSLVPGQIQSGEMPADYAPPEIGAAAGSKGASGPKNALPAKYANADSSALRATVEPKGENKFDFDLK
jgi:hypothetical protein